MLINLKKSTKHNFFQLLIYRRTLIKNNLRIHGSVIRYYGIKGERIFYIVPFTKFS